MSNTADPPEPASPPAPPAPPPPAAPPPPVQNYSPPPPPRPGKTAEQVEGEYRDMVAQIRAEAASHRISARDANEKLAAAQNEMVTLRETLERTRAQEKADYNAELTQARLEAVALRHGLEDLDLLALVKREGIKIGDDRKITGIEEAVTALKAEKPHLFRGQQTQTTRTTTGASGAPPPAGGGTPGGGKPEDVRHLTKAEYEARRRQAISALRRG